ncbi:hypothetical protein NBRC111894_3009 [Sporolactobacillus inulinus]|uniref:Uncharacterized protein n=1 Tax=Sporolactobacillus inulinus TaxID=2078 RepID=A0A4Y1ZED0_9BACL|nr:hypothetical protein NBRC111894_3009 [Sporolactobacillus inulinus]
MHCFLLCMLHVKGILRKIMNLVKFCGERRQNAPTSALLVEALL